MWFLPSRWKKSQRSRLRSGKLLTELRAAEALIEAGKCVVYDREDQRRRFENIYSGRS